MGLRAIRWFDTHPLPDASSVKTAVLDTGIDATHPDLKSNISAYNHEGTSATDIVGHETHVAGIMAADFNTALVLPESALRRWSSRNIPIGHQNK